MAKDMQGVGTTAHFTAAVWQELGVPGAGRFVTAKGQWVRRLVSVGGGLLGLRGGYSVTSLFLAPRHLGLNVLLEQSKATQVIELAAGFSARGAEWTAHHRGVYIEIDQPAVISAKRSRFTPLPNHHLLSADLRQADLLTPIQALLDPDAPTLIIMEGVTGYLGEVALRQVLQQLHHLASWFRYPTVYIDIYLRLERKQHGRVFWAMLPAQMLWKIIRAPMQLFLRDQTHMQTILEAEGFCIRRFYSATELSTLANYPPPPLNLFYVAEIVPK